MQIEEQANPYWKKIVELDKELLKEIFSPFREGNIAKQVVAKVIMFAIAFFLKLYQVFQALVYEIWKSKKIQNVKIEKNSTISFSAASENRSKHLIKEIRETMQEFEDQHLKNSSFVKQFIQININNKAFKKSFECNLSLGLGSRQQMKESFKKDAAELIENIEKFLNKELQENEISSIEIRNHIFSLNDHFHIFIIIFGKRRALKSS